MKEELETVTTPKVFPKYSNINESRSLYKADTPVNSSNSKVITKDTKIKILFKHDGFSTISLLSGHYKLKKDTFILISLNKNTPLQDVKNHFKRTLNTLNTREKRKKKISSLTLSIYLQANS